MEFQRWNHCGHSGSRAPAGVDDPAGGRVVGTSDPSLFLSKYGFPADFSYLGSSLSNGGETVTLVDSAAAVADTVTYDDAAPWVVSPDGGGRRSSISDLGLDNSVATSWHASSAVFGSPRAANSVAPLPLSAITPTGKPDSGPVRGPAGHGAHRRDTAHLQGDVRGRRHRAHARRRGKPRRRR